MPKRGKVPSESRAVARVVAKHLRKAKVNATQLLRKSDRDKSVAGVHDLRVALRRLSVAAKILGHLLPEKAARKLRRRAKQLRRSAGKLRDEDVLRASVAAVAAADPRLADAAGVVTKLLKGSRAALLRSLRQEVKELNEREFWHWAHAKVVQRLAAVPVGDLRLQELAATIIPHHVQALRASLITAQSKADDALHAARIAAKGLRYSLDLFAECLGPTPHGELHPVALHLQELLGDIHDDAVFAKRCRDLADEPGQRAGDRAALRRLARAYGRRRKARLVAFEEFCAEHAAALSGSSADAGDLASTLLH